MAVLRRRALVTVLVVLGTLVSVGAASADPTQAKNSFSGMATCTNGLDAPFVVNSGNGQGSGSQEKNTAEWTPAHITVNNLVFHPSAFDLTFSFTPAGGTTESFTNTDSRDKPGPVTCDISGSQTDAAGDTFSLSGSVTGWFT